MSPRTELPSRLKEPASGEHLAHLFPSSRRLVETAALFAKDALLSLMSASVKLLPSGHEFFVAGQESVLESLMGADYRSK